MSKWYPSAVIGYTVVITICLIFLGWVGTGLIRWANTPYYPPQPTALEIAAQACKEKGGVLKTKWVERPNSDAYSEEVVDTCEGIQK